MRLLLDTHALLWALAEPELLGPIARERITDPDHEVFVSPVNIWEIAIKRSAGRLDAPPDLLRDIAEAGFAPLPMTLAHAHTAGRLPRHHGDPFDRLLIGQAIAESLTLVTVDGEFPKYAVELLAADR
jgi:PIN domain nuclease of toxin-antitoxin system